MELSEERERISECSPCSHGSYVGEEDRNVSRFSLALVSRKSLSWERRSCSHEKNKPESVDSLNAHVQELKLTFLLDYFILIFENLVMS